MILHGVDQRTAKKVTILAFDLAEDYEVQLSLLRKLQSSFVAEMLDTFQVGHLETEHRVLRE